MKIFITGLLIFANLFFLSAGPQIKILNEDITLDEMPQHSRKNFAIKIKNIGDADLEITQVKPTCGCTTILAPPDLIPPGEETEAIIAFDSGTYKGNVTRTIKVFSNDPGNPEIQVKFKTKVFRELILEPEIINFGSVVQRSGDVKTATLKHFENKKIEIEKIEGYDEKIVDISWEGPDKNNVIKFKVKLKKGIKEGSINQKLNVIFKGDENKKFKFYINGYVYNKDLFFRPPFVNYSASNKTQITKRFCVIESRSQVPFKIKSFKNTYKDLFKINLKEIQPYMHQFEIILLKKNIKRGSKFQIPVKTSFKNEEKQIIEINFN